MRKIFIDCPQEIPCNPCMSLCRTGAVTVKDLTGRPETEPALCVGCDNCVAGCPGQACFLIDEEEEQETAYIDFPFEYLPVPVIGEKREAYDNNGCTVCIGTVAEVLSRKAWAGTRVVRLAVPRSKVYQVRGMARKPITEQEG
ncbi:MAG: 4Fe-4S ferredoxin [Lachnospiraceae bacterium]|nr:4Fe-4S ferredoxin [Lachnospiraceae bacterium]